MVEVVAHEVGLNVKDELVGEVLRPGKHQLGFAGLGGCDLEDVTVDIVHCEKGRSHAAARVQELSAT